MTAPRATLTRPRVKPDPLNPKALLKFMMQDWAPQSKALPARQANWKAFARRRALLSAAYPGQTLVIPTGHERTRANDTVYRFRPGSDFFWLTGNQEPDGVLVLAPTGRQGHTAHLFVEPNPGRSSETFYTDRAKGELWVGPRLGVEQSAALAGVDEGHALGDLKKFLRGRRGVRVLRGLSAGTQKLRRTAKGKDKALAQTLSELRLCKDELEIAALGEAIASTRRGFEDVIAALPHARGEREVEGRFNLRARIEGHDVGYGTIAAAGAHACILHWTHNDGPVKRGDLLLLDAGVEGRQIYTADITRTLPVSGTFSPAQRTIYELVWQAQQAGIRAIKPGAPYLAPHWAAMKVLAEGLHALGILKVAPEKALDRRRQLYKRYTLHGTSHMLGLDVHDCAQARNDLYRHGYLEAGMVLTVEPGLYFQLDDLTVPEEYRGIGVRIEDDLLVTRQGFTNLSASIPSEAGAVEKWMAKVWAKGHLDSAR